ncbi:hypothetical protein WH52_01170 [Tenacibaculum holothuriorum]|uniref:DUF4890 domain-containing protein n=1 Tax=Tenacibaculum holothuriorum TaxID=1635173 RepID=A0A1Y2PFS6_9FLAO|nr:hypothetical protein [Tenacibaculum holothuriorum]OSY89285.1 hypothetical protein WH52_01170 [Tenacibaculum holothuriorum]
MKIFKNILVLIVTLFVTTISFGQNKEVTETQKEQIKEQLEQYFEKLNLTEDQQTKFADITKKYGTQMKALKSSGKSKFKKYRAYKSIQKNKNKEMKDLLNKEQYSTYEEMQEKMKEKMKAKRNK